MRVSSRAPSALSAPAARSSSNSLRAERIDGPRQHLALRFRFLRVDRRADLGEDSLRGASICGLFWILGKHRELRQPAEAVGRELAVADLAGDANALEQRFAPCGGFAQRQVRAGEIVERDPEAVDVARLAGELDRRQQVADGNSSDRCAARDRAEIRQRDGEPALLSLLAEERHALLVEHDCAIEISFRERDAAELSNRPPDLFAVVELAIERERLLPELLRDVEVAPSERANVAPFITTRARVGFSASAVRRMSRSKTRRPSLR